VRGSLRRSRPNKFPVRIAKEFRSAGPPEVSSLFGASCRNREGPTRPDEFARDKSGGRAAAVVGLLPARRRVTTSREIPDVLEIRRVEKLKSARGAGLEELAEALLSRPDQNPGAVGSTVRRTEHGVVDSIAALDAFRRAGLTGKIPTRAGASRPPNIGQDPRQ
jgi:hypothetical protein